MASAMTDKCPSCGADLGKIAWQQLSLACASCGVRLRSNGPILMAVGIIIAIPCTIWAYRWALDQEGALGLIWLLPLELLVLIACAVPLAFLFRVKLAR